MVLSGSAVMQRVAETLYERGLSEAKMTSIERRLARFIANERIVVPLIWKLFLAQVLAPFRGQQLHFVLDNTPFRDELTIVYLGLLVHSRVLPVAWAVMPAQTKWDEGQWHIVGRLLDQVSVHLPETCCTLIADRGLAGMPLVKLCTNRGWHYLLRVCGEHTCRRYFNGKLEQSWKRFDQIVRHRQALAGMAQPGSGKRRRWTPTSAWCGIQPVRNRGCSSAIRVPDADKCRSMPGVCVWKRHFKMAKVAAGTSKLVGVWTGPTWITCCSRCFWPSGGLRIWRQPASIMGNVSALIGWIAETRVSFDWDGSGSWISCGGFIIEPP
jgi:hypothetical protein